jgi:hypothetical protein
MGNFRSGIPLGPPHPVLSVRKLAFILKTTPEKLILLSKTAGRHYSPFDRKEVKSNGKIKWRHIDGPSISLKIIQKKINKFLLKDIVSSLPEGMTGGILDRSIFKNAEKHVNQEAIATLDLKDCFPKNNNKKIFSVWRNYLKAGNDVASILTKLTTFQRRLPQGSPTSSSLCNLALFRLYKKMEKYCNEKGLNLSLYVDDVTISGKTEIVRSAISEIVNFIQNEGYAVRKNKVEIMTADKTQKTTGVVVNKKISISRKTREKVRKEIVEMSKMEKFSARRLKSLWGKIHHIRQASLKHGDRLLDLANLLLLDKLGSVFYERITSEKEITRECKNTKRHRYGL